MKIFEALVLCASASVIGSVSMPRTQEPETRAQAPLKKPSFEAPCNISVNHYRGKRVKLITIYAKLPAADYDVVWLCGYKSEPPTKADMSRSKCVHAQSVSIGEDDAVYVYCGSREMELTSNWSTFEKARGVL